MEHTFTIRATAMSDDRVFKVDFDAVEWAEQASEDELLDVFRCDFGGDMATDNIAYWVEGNSELDDLFKYLYLIHGKKEEDGFECLVSPEQFQEWTKTNRPGVWTKAVEKGLIDDISDLEENT